jgi:CDP-glucose 4,6-dehydratase
MGVEPARVDPRFWRDKRVFLTGHTGFKGSWLSLWLQEMGAVLKGYSLAPDTDPSLFHEAAVDANMNSEIGDIRKRENLVKSMMSFNPDIVIHMAAQPLVRKSYIDPAETYETNVMGTVNVLEACRKCDQLRSIVVVTTDKCYENREWIYGYREHDAMGGYDPYSSSKGCTELVVSAYQRSFFNLEQGPALASARAGNVIGGGDWSADRLVPDILSAFAKAEPVIIRNPKATRPWQHVLEPLSGYLILAERLCENRQKYSGGWNLGPDDEDCKAVDEVISAMVEKWGEGAQWHHDTSVQPHEAGLLKLDCTKAKQLLNWYPKWKLDITIEKIIHWHKEWMNGKDAKALCVQEIKDFTTA